MKQAWPKIRTEVADLTPREWEQVRAAAAAVETRGGEAGTLILPGRRELYWLERRGPGEYVLRVTDEEEIARTVGERWGW
jgi:hypothetical protein